MTMLAAVYVLAAALLLAAAPAAGKKKPHAPNLDAVSYGVNALLGRTPHEQRQQSSGQKLFRFSGGKNLPGLPYRQPKQARDMSTAEDCLWTGVSREVSWSTSASTLASQAKSSSTGFDRSVDLGVSVPIGAATATASTTVRNAAVFGNSHTSSKQFEEREDGYTYTYDATARRSLYRVEVKYGEFKNGWWTKEMKAACRKLGHRPSDSAVIRFFEDVGSHGLKEATMGQYCTASVFMEKGFSMSSYEEHNSKSRSTDVAFMGFGHESSTSELDQHTSSESYGFGLSTSNKKCIGALATGSSCNSDAGFKGTRDNPAIVEWTLVPIWTMAVPGLRAGAKAAMKRVFTSLLQGAVDCRQKYCHGHGACAPKQSAWSNIGSRISYISFWDSRKCFCDDDWVGETCGTSRTRSIARSLWTGYRNDFDKRLLFEAPVALCGVSSRHSNRNEDRQFRFKTCAPKGVTASPTNAAQQLGITSYDGKWTKECRRANDVLHAVDSSHNSRKEDRQWQWSCQGFGGQLSSCAWTGYVNSWDRPFDYTCGTGKVLTGVMSHHSNHHEDRQFKFRCCTWTYTI